MDSRLLRRVAWTPVLLFAMLAIAAPAQATFPGKNGKIAFTRIQEHENGEIWTINPDGTGLTKLTDATGYENDFGGDVAPTWSPDGKRLLFGRNSGDPAQDGLVVMSADGSNQTRIASAAGFNGTPWSPDGRIAVSECAEECDIYLINPDGGGKTLLVPAASNPSWSRDGAKLAFVTCCYPNETISFMNADGSGRRVLTEGFGPRWGPDDVIAFGRRDGPPHYDWEVFTIKADGTGETRITDNLESDGHAGFAPDGDRLLYRTITNIFNPGHSLLMTVDADGTDPFLVATDIFTTRWSPDGTRLVFEDEGGLGLIGVDGTGRSTLTAPEIEREIHDVSPDWQPIPPPRRADHKNAAQFCKAQREHWGDAKFGKRYQSHGKCVSANH